MFGDHSGHRPCQGLSQRRIHMLDLANRRTRRAGRLGSHHDLALRAKPGDSLTLDEMRASLPTIFATEEHESRSDRYVFISTWDMLEALMAKDFLPVEARVSRTRDESRQAFTSHLIRAVDRKVGDVSFEVLLRNAHDGTSRYKFMAGLLKLLCLNGLVVSDGTVSEVSIMHTGNRERQIGQVIEGAYTVLDQGPKVLERVQAWQGLELKDDERHAFAEAAHHYRFADSDGKVHTPIKADQLLIPRRPQEVGRRDLWSVFNVVQENAIRGGLTAMGRDE